MNKLFARIPLAVTAPCDGSVQFISDSIELTVWRNLSTMADGAALPGNLFQ